MSAKLLFRLEGVRQGSGSFPGKCVPKPELGNEGNFRFKRASVPKFSDTSAMPKVFEKDGYRFFFYSNEHRPIHVHVRYGTDEAVFNVDPVVELRESIGLKVRELSHAEELARAHLGLIIQKWHEHLN